MTIISKIVQQSSKQKYSKVESKSSLTIMMIMITMEIIKKLMGKNFLHPQIDLK